MEIGLNLYSVRNLLTSEKDIIETVQKLKKSGYSYMQFSGAPFDADMLVRVCKETDTPIYLTHVPINRIIDDTERLMEEHARFNCKNIGLGAMALPDVLDEDACKRKIAQLDKAGEIMEKNGFKFCYHHHHREFYRHGTKTVFDYMIENAPHIYFTADTYWLQYGGVDVIPYLEKLGKRIVCAHLKDYGIEQYDKDGKPDVRPVFKPLGEGTMDFKKIVTKLKEIGVQYYFVEQDNAATLPDTINQVTISAKYAKAQL